MPSFSRRSRNIKDTCTLVLRTLFDRIIMRRDCTVLNDGGARTVERQAELSSTGVSQVKDPLKGKHVPKHPDGTYDPNGKSQAIDVMPYYGGVDWRTDKELWDAVEAGNMKEARGILENIKRLHNFTGYVQGVADEMGIAVRNGQDWDSDGKFNDQRFTDSPHWEIISNNRR